MIEEQYNDDEVSLMDPNMPKKVKIIKYYFEKAQ
jgi:hypothetical protein